MARVWKISLSSAPASIDQWVHHLIWTFVFYMDARAKRKSKKFKSHTSPHQQSINWLTLELRARPLAQPIIQLAFGDLGWISKSKLKAKAQRRSLTIQLTARDKLCHFSDLMKKWNSFLHIYIMNINSLSRNYRFCTQLNSEKKKHPENENYWLRKKYIITTLNSITLPNFPCASRCLFRQFENFYWVKLDTHSINFDKLQFE
jgi:hypothetical protein